jgi:uncharacterized protein (DUF1330 family)
MPKAYVVCDIDVTDPERYEDYKRLSNAAADRYGARFLVRGGPTTVLEGEWRPARFVVLEFEDEAAARRWYDSPEYAEAKRVRQASATSSIVLVPGA